MEVIAPQFGLFFWTVVIFLTLFFLLKKFAWVPILKALAEREHEIASKLNAAKEAEARMAELTAQNEKLLREARIESERILKEANTLKEQIISEARSQAAVEINRDRQKMMQEIEREKNTAIAQIRELTGDLALMVAEKVLRKAMRNKKEQEAYVQSLINEIDLNPNKLSAN